MSRFSLSTRLSLFFIIIVLVVTVVLSGIVFYEFGNKINQQISYNLTDTATHKANEINSLLQFERTDLLSWRSSSVMVDVVVDDLDKRINNELHHLKKYYDLKGDLYVFNTSGILIASTQTHFLGQSIPHLWKTDKDYQFVFKHNEPFIKNNSVIAHVIALNPPQIQAQGYLVLTHSWDDIDHYLMSEQNRFGLRKISENTLELFTKKGTESIEITDDFSRKKLWFFDNQPYLGAISTIVSIGDFSFQIAAFVPEKIAREPLIKLMQELLLTAAIVVFPMLLIVSFLSRHFVAPIKNLTQTIRHIENSDDLSIQVAVSGKDEVSDLAYAFNRMTKRLAEVFGKCNLVEKELENLNLNLENQVIERTAQLQDTLQKLKSAQTQLVQSEKMASLGQLVAGIAHEINNPIGAIYANMPPLKEYIEELENALNFIQNCVDEADKIKIQTYLESIDYDFITSDLTQLLNSQQQAAERIRNIVLALRNFSRLDQGEIKSVLLEEGLDSTLQMLAHHYKSRIVIEKNYTLNELVDCYAGELNQVFMNILANAVQAIPNEGKITIVTAKINHHAVIKITDTGTGMTQQVKEKIFDPFFTTKDVGEGTGLGLSISYGIIEKHQGTLAVESELNQGSCFTITIPLHRSKDC